MAYRRQMTPLLVVFVLIVLANTGCFTATGPSLGILSIPIPISPYFQKTLEDKFHVEERYARVPIMGPITTGPVVALDPPTDDEVWWALERARPVQGGIPFLYETQRNNVTIIKEKIADYVDPPRFIPLIGPAQLHHAHYCCKVYFTEITTVGWPVPHTLEDEVVEVLYIDHNHFHMVGPVDPGCSNY